MALMMLLAIAVYIFFTDVTCRTGIAITSGTAEFNPVFCGFDLLNLGFSAYCFEDHFCSFVFKAS
jgi:hypothetical protein